MTVDIPLGSLIELKRGDAAILGRYDRYAAWGEWYSPMLILNLDIWHGYNVEKMVEQGWHLTIVSVPADACSDPSKSQ